MLQLNDLGMRKIKRPYGIFKPLAALLAICFSFSSCDPWKGELEGIYEAAQNGDRLARFAVIEEHNSFDDIVPEDTMRTYLWEFVREGNQRAISLGILMDFKKVDHSQGQKAIEQQDKIDLKWHNEGVKYNNFVSYRRLGDLQMDKYRKTGHLQDSLKAEELYQKSIDAGNMHLRMERDAKAGIKAIVLGGIEYAGFSYDNTFNELGTLERYIRSGSYAFSYISSAAVKILFTSMWWKVALLLFGMVVLLALPITMLIGFFSSWGRESEQAGVAKNALIFGFWSSMCFFAAISQGNLVWLNNITSLMFPPSAYGLQQYLAIIMNWIALIYPVVVVIRTIRSGIENQIPTVNVLMDILAKVLIYIVSYAIAQVGGYLILVVIFCVIGMAAATSVVASTPAMAKDLVEGVVDMVENSVSDALHHDKSCSNCRHYTSHQTCSLTDRTVSRGYRCSSWGS